MKKYEYILFDADNTLFDFSLAEYNAFKEVCEKCSIPFSEELYEAYTEINDKLWKRLEKKEVTLDFIKLERFRALLVTFVGYKDNDETLSVAEHLRDTYIGCLSNQACMIDGAEEICSALSKKYKLYIVTNGVSKIQRNRFALSPIKEYIEKMYVSEEIGVAKPDTKYFDYVIEDIGENDRRKYLVIGDSLTSDCDGAINSGIDICRYNPKNLSSNGRNLTYNIEKLSQLEEIL